MTEQESLEQEACRLARAGAWTDPNAEKISRRQLELNSSDQDALTRLGRILTATGRQDEALKVYSQCLELDPANTIARNWITRLGGKHVDLLQSEQADRRLEPIQPFISLVRSALRDPLAVNIQVDSPSEDDLHLIECWMPGIPPSRRDAEERRMLSARMAETAVATYFRARGKSVEDISLTQLSTSGNSDWKLFDLQVDGTPIDVKNARRSGQNPKRYVSHCVPRFKETRDLRAVTVAGVLSDWLALDSLHFGGYSVLFLGLVDSKRVDQIISEVSGKHLRVSFRDGLRSPRFLPPWLFSYSPAEYLERNQALGQLAEIASPDSQLASVAKINPTAVYLAAGLRYKPSQALTLSKVQNELLDSLLARHSRIGLCLSSVFLSVLEHFVRVLVDGAPSEFSPREYAGVVFPVNDRSRPLFFYDPLHTVDTLLETLSTLWSARSSGLSGFKIFHLRDLNILQGKRSEADPHWTTLLAYCGGRVADPFPRPCGTTPLVLGSDQSCECGKLICPNCGYCSEPCSKRHGRKGPFTIDPEVLKNAME